MRGSTLSRSVRTVHRAPRTRRGFWGLGYTLTALRLGARFRYHIEGACARHDGDKDSATSAKCAIARASREQHVSPHLSATQAARGPAGAGGAIAIPGERFRARAKSARPLPSFAKGRSIPQPISANLRRPVHFRQALTPSVSQTSSPSRRARRFLRRRADRCTPVFHVLLSFRIVRLHLRYHYKGESSMQNEMSQS